MAHSMHLGFINGNQSVQWHNVPATEKHDTIQFFLPPCFIPGEKESTCFCFACFTCLLCNGISCQRFFAVHAFAFHLNCSRDKIHTRTSYNKHAHTIKPTLKFTHTHSHTRSSNSHNSIHTQHGGRCAAPLLLHMNADSI